MSNAGPSPAAVGADRPPARALSPLWMGLGLAVFALAVLNTVSALTGRPGIGMVDLDVYRWGGIVARTGSNLYHARFSRSFEFTYPPISAVAFMPLSLVPLRVLELLSVSAGMVAVVFTSWLSLGLAGYRRSVGRLGLALAIGGTALALEPVRETLRFGQVNLVLLAIVVGDLCLPRASRWSGIGIGLATGFKLTPAIFVPYLLLTGRRRAALRAVVTAVGTIVVGFVVLPTESRQFWIGHLFADSNRVGNLMYVANQSLNGLLRRATSTGSAHALWVVGAAVIGVVGMALAVRASRRGEEMAGVVVCALTGLLVSPVSWSHHWVWVIPALVLGVDAALRRSPLFWIAVAAGVALFDGATTKGVIWLVPFNHGSERHWTPSQAVAGNLYVLIGLVTLVVAATWVGAGATARRAARVRSAPRTDTGRGVEPAGRPAGDHGHG